MINYTEHLTLLMQDVVTRVPTLSFIDIADVLVFGRFGRSEAEGAFATCHCLTLPPSEPGYYFWRDRADRTRSPGAPSGSSPSRRRSRSDTRQVKYLISFTLPRFLRSVARIARARSASIARATDAWVAKLDTVIHELYHIDPEHNGIRRIERETAPARAHSHGSQFLANVAQMVSRLSRHVADPADVRFPEARLRRARSALRRLCGASFRPFPSYPQRFQETAGRNQPHDARRTGRRRDRTVAGADSRAPSRKTTSTSGSFYDTLVADGLSVERRRFKR